MIRQADIAAVVIGRNEGARLLRCLDSLTGQVSHVVYVDSGSTDGSVAAARQLGVSVLELDTDVPFTAARARNAGLESASSTATAPAYVQFVDGDCEVRAGWIDTARAFLVAHPDVAVVCGRRRERFPEASVYNRLIDMEWDTPVGKALACGGDALMRTDALRAVGGYDPGLIAGEEPELCLRLRRAGWKIWRLDAEMTLHDADMHRFGQWWNRARRAGHTYAEGAAMYGRAPERHKVREMRSALVWGALLPAVVLIGSAFTPWAMLLGLAYPAQVLRQRMRGTPWIRAAFNTIGKFPEATGVIGYHWNRALGRDARIIEYK
jgi:GT2 family glycosyltransferase